MVLGKETNEQKIAHTLSEVWGMLTKEEQQQLVEAVVIRRYQKNEPIYHEGEKPSCLFIPSKGKVKIYKEGVGGRQQIVRMVNTREFFGYRASFVGENYTTEAGAFEDSTILCIPLTIAHRIITTNNAVSIYFLQQLAYYLGIAEENTVNLTQKHIRGRLAEALLRLKNTFGTTDDGKTLAISASREDLANLANMTTSNAIRTLSAFAQEGIVKIDGRRITILDERLLEQTSENG